MNHQQVQDIEDARAIAQVHLLKVIADQSPKSRLDAEAVLALAEAYACIAVPARPGSSRANS